MENSSLREDAVSDGGIVFDTSSGFSVEEQREVLDRINSLNVEKGMVPQEGLLLSEAKKRGHLFPLFVNVTALLLLAGGFFLLMFFHNRDEQDIREGQAPIGLAERSLIQEIRRETTSQINEKEEEINEMVSRLEAAGEEYRELQASVENLNEEQRERAEYLLNIQEEYQGMLSTLQEERAKILEDSRIRETALRVQAEERAGELSSRIEQSEASLGEAMEELSRLSGEQERAAAAEAQLGGYYKILDTHLASGQNDEAWKTLAAMKEFLSGPVFMTSRSQETRKQNQLAALAAIEKMLAAVQGLPLPVDTSYESAAEETQAVLEQTIQERDNRIADLNSQLSSEASERERLAAEHEISLEEIARLNTANEDQMRQIEARDAELEAARAANQRQVNELSNAITDFREQVDARQAQITTLQSENERLNTRVGELETGLRAIEQILQNR